MEIRRQMLLKEEEKRKWQVLVSKDRLGWRSLRSSFPGPRFSSLTVNLKTWIWWWYLVTTAMFNSLRWYLLPGWQVGRYTDQPAADSHLLSSPLCLILTGIIGTGWRQKRLLSAQRCCRKLEMRAKKTSDIDTYYFVLWGWLKFPFILNSFCDLVMPTSAFDKLAEF